MSKPFPTTIGIVGGGQLGKMLIESAQRWNVEFNILDAAHAPAARYAKSALVGSLTDIEKITELAAISDVITYEIEHINAEALISLETRGVNIVPSPKILFTLQNKGRQKQFYQDHNLPTKKFVISSVEKIDSIKETLNIFNGNKLVIKSCTGGYDGKGVSIIERDSLSFAGLKNDFKGDIVIEEFSENNIELSVIVARNRAGEIKTFPIVQMEFDPIKNLVDYLYAPADLNNIIENMAQSISIEAVKALNGVGIFAVELFLEPDGALYINEIAPRPHNSGHHTIEACYTSQYEQLVRILLDLPLGNTDLLQPVVMTNVIGPENVEGNYSLQGMETLFATKGANLNWYNKSETRPGRKMGHFTVMDADLTEAIAKSENIKKSLRIVSA